MSHAQYTDPRWKDFSRQIIHKAGHKCEHCHRPNRYLVVHHLCYHTDLMLWEYAPWEVLVLCRPCHQNTHTLDAEWGMYVRQEPKCHRRRSKGHRLGRDFAQIPLFCNKEHA